MNPTPSIVLLTDRRADGNAEIYVLGRNCSPTSRLDQARIFDSVEAALKFVAGGTAEFHAKYTATIVPLEGDRVELPR